MSVTIEKYRPFCINIIGGVGSGKTSMLIGIAVKSAKHTKVLLCSSEEDFSECGFNDSICICNPKTMKDLMKSILEFIVRMKIVMNIRTKLIIAIDMPELLISQKSQNIQPIERRKFYNFIKLMKELYSVEFYITTQQKRSL